METENSCNAEIIDKSSAVKVVEIDKKVITKNSQCSDLEIINGNKFPLAIFSTFPVQTYIILNRKTRRTFKKD